METSKYEKWILKEMTLAPLPRVPIHSGNKTLRHIRYTYECPYCHKTYLCTITNEFNVRKCRWCNKKVSPYNGEICEDEWMTDEEVKQWQNNKSLDDRK